MLIMKENMTWFMSFDEKKGKGEGLQLSRLLQPNVEEDEVNASFWLNVNNKLGVQVKI